MDDGTRRAAARAAAEATDDTRRTVVRQILAGVLGGAGAWLVGYLTTYVVFGPRVESDIVSTAVEPWRISGLLFFNAHTVTTEIVQPGDLSRRNLLVAGDGSPLLYLLPPITLALAGLLVAHVTEPRGAPLANLGTGAMVVLGYGVLSVVGALVFVAAAGETQFRPARTGAVLVAGILYPLVFAGAGGFADAFVRP